MINFNLLRILIIICLLFVVASKNGAVVGTVYNEVKGPLFPTIAVHSQNEEYVVPFI